jgi:hypothetical protein
MLLSPQQTTLSLLGVESLNNPLIDQPLSSSSSSRKVVMMSTSKLETRTISGPLQAP